MNFIVGKTYTFNKVFSLFLTILGKHGIPVFYNHSFDYNIVTDYKQEKSMNKQQLAAKIWESANQMRSKIEANEYKDYILGFIFYKPQFDIRI